MGKNKIKPSGGDTQHSPSTVFVSNFSFSSTTAQLEEIFSEVGPIRRCFLVTKKGSNEHRGFGYVQFASVEDATRAIELKNGSSVGGRKIGVKYAMNRAPLEQRRPKGNQVVDKVNGEENTDASAVEEASNLKQTEVEKTKDDSEVDIIMHKVINNKESSSHSQRKGEKRPIIQTGTYPSSDKQRVAKTVIIGGLLDADMAEDIHNRAKKCGTVCSITYPLPREELEFHGLARDGCKMEASSVLFTSVKSARACVASLHKQELCGGIVWARQLGGEGAKTKKWKLIVRNLPFKAKAKEITEMFAPIGFVWEVFIPRNSETGVSKGFAFVKFTSKQDAENAIKKMNGKKIGSRSIAVDWAISKNLYTQEHERSDNEVKSETGSDFENDDTEIDTKIDVDPTNESDSTEEEAEPIEFDFSEEADVARKVLRNIISSSSKVDTTSSEKNDDVILPEEKKDEIITVPDNNTPIKSKKIKPIEGEDDLHRTVFINNIPFEITNEEVKQRFSAFGEVESFFPVLHPVTKRPRGTGFLKFKTVEAADATFSAAENENGSGILLKGRQLKILRALNKENAQKKEQEKSTKEVQDHRNLYLTKEGLILEGSAAAIGVSANDMAKRKSLQEKKTVKLQSPNFHVSKTRLIIYNLPKTMSEKVLKKLCIDAVISRATKQTPVIRQIKFLENGKKGKDVSKNHSRGVAFVEFEEHQHALVALRVLNNNPETFGPEHRPIVEFALDNVQTLKQRQEKNQWIQGPRNNTQGSSQNNDLKDDKNSRKRKSRSDEPSKKSSINKEEELKKNEDSKENKILLPKKKAAIIGGSQRIVNKPIVERVEKKRSRELKEEMDITINSRKKSKMNRDPLGRDQVDKLDKLIEQYRSKFTRPSVNAQSHGTKNLKRWFQS